MLVCVVGLSYLGYRQLRSTRIVAAATTAPEARTAAIAPTPSNARERWAVDFLAALGNSAPSADTIAMVVEWTLAEDSGPGAFDRNNPLNTTMPGFAENVTINEDGVKGYADRQSGLDAAIHTVTNGLYDDVVSALQANDPERAKQALWASPWAGSHYGYGANWPAYQVEVAAPADDTRAQLVSYALSLQGIPYIYGGRSASGGDCSGTMQHIYLTVAGIDIGGTTFSQYPNLQPIEFDQVQPGDLWYGQYSNDQHTGMIADVDNDGRWDLINNGGLSSNMHVDLQFMDMDYFNQHTMGFRRAL